MAQNNWGVNKDGTNDWVKTSNPLVLTSEDDATIYSEADAITVANYLSQGGEVFKPKKPTQHPPR